AGHFFLSRLSHLSRFSRIQLVSCGFRAGHLAGTTRDRDRRDTSRRDVPPKCPPRQSHSTVHPTRLLKSSAGDLRAGVTDEQRSTTSAALESGQGVTLRKATRPPHASAPGTWTPMIVASPNAQRTPN